MAEFKVFICDRHREMCPKCMEELTRPGSVPTPVAAAAPTRRKRRRANAFDAASHVAQLVSILTVQPKITRTEVLRQMNLTEWHLRAVARVARRRKLVVGKRGLRLAVPGPQMSLA